MKDPAFLFYPNDYIGGTMGMTFEEKGAYIDLLMTQFNRGHMTSHMISHMLGQKYDQIWEVIKSKFIQDESGNFYNERLEYEQKKDVAIVKRKSKIFRKPPFEEVKNYCIERNNKIDPQQFLDFYDSKDWMIGKNKMKDWKAAIRTWEKNKIQKDEKRINKGHEWANNVRRMGESLIEAERAGKPLSLESND